MFGSKPSGIDPEIVALRERLASLEASLAAVIENAKQESFRVWQEFDRRQAAAATAMWSNAPLHVSEDEEDAKWQLDNGFINKKEYADILEAAGLEPNVEIHY